MVTESRSVVAREKERCWEGTQGKITKRQEETFGGSRYVYYLNCGDRYVHLSKLIKFYTLNVYHLLYVN